ncbi:MAG: hypothetical protein JWR19_1183 [Pedosphaera sp.]|nr:hypothetical protein [Pedosphaera sp.]
MQHNDISSDRPTPGFSSTCSQFRLGHLIVASALLLTALVIRAPAQDSTQPTPLAQAEVETAPYAVIAKGAHNRVWQRTTTETGPQGEVR